MAVQRSFPRRPPTIGVARRRRERHAPPGPPASRAAWPSRQPRERELLGAAALELELEPAVRGDAVDLEVSQR